MTDRPVSTRELAHRLGVAKETVRSYCASGLIAAAYRAERQWFIPAADADAFAADYQRYSRRTRAAR